MRNLILLVEDHLDIARALVVLLERHGYRCVHFSHGNDALAFLRTEKPRIVVLDLMLPDLSGWEVLKAIRSSPDIANLPVVILTSAPELRDSIESSWQGFLSKSEAWDELIPLIERVAI